MLLGQLLKSVSKKYQKINVKVFLLIAEKLKKGIFFLQLKETKHQELNLLMMRF